LAIITTEIHLLQLCSSATSTQILERDRRSITSAIACVISARSDQDREPIIVYRWKNGRLAGERVDFVRLLAHKLRNPLGPTPTLISLCREQTHNDGYLNTRGPLPERHSTFMILSARPWKS
jgi:hypothetical protein